MQQILIAGAGIVGQNVAHWLSASNDYEVHLADVTQEHSSSQGIKRITLDVTNKEELTAYINEHRIGAVVGTLPHRQLLALTHHIATLPVHYFDVTEDTRIAAMLSDINTDLPRAIVPQCGLAPGYINVIAHELIAPFDTVESVKLRCGAIPEHTSNNLHYAFTWSIDGLVNEYINPCQTLRNSLLTPVPALSEIENIEIDGQQYEAFHTSGGLARMAEGYEGKINYMDYKTIRYPGHAEKMHFLLNDLKLSGHRDELIRILQRAIPHTHKDVVVIYVSVNGYINQRLTQKTFVKKYYPQTVFGRACSALQLTTTAGLCSMIDLIVQNPQHYQGVVQHQQFTLQDVYNNRFGAPLAPSTQRSQHESIATT